LGGFRWRFIHCSRRPLGAKNQPKSTAAGHRPETRGGTRCHLSSKHRTISRCVKVFRSRAVTHLISRPPTNLQPLASGPAAPRPDAAIHRLSSHPLHIPLQSGSWDAGGLPNPDRSRPAPRLRPALLGARTGGRAAHAHFPCSPTPGPAVRDDEPARWKGSRSRRQPVVQPPKAKATTHTHLAAPAFEAKRQPSPGARRTKGALCWVPGPAPLLRGSHLRPAPPVTKLTPRRPMVPQRRRTMLTALSVSTAGLTGGGEALGSWRKAAAEMGFDSGWEVKGRARVGLWEGSQSTRACIQRTGDAGARPVGGANSPARSARSARAVSPVRRQVRRRPGAPGRRRGRRRSANRRDPPADAAPRRARAASRRCDAWRPRAGDHTSG